MTAKVVDKINAMQHRLITNAASRRRTFAVPPPKRVEQVEAPETSPPDAEREPPAAKSAP